MSGVPSTQRLPQFIKACARLEIRKGLTGQTRSEFVAAWKPHVQVLAGQQYDLAEAAHNKLLDKIAQADTNGSNWLAKGNEYAEKGNTAKAEQCYAKGQFWLDRSNKLRGDA